jgi:hypothetical protein
MELICLQIDLARQKERVDFVKSYIDFAVENGSNPQIPSQAVESKTAVPPMVIWLFWSRRRGSNPRTQRPEVSCKDFLSNFG